MADATEEIFRRLATLEKETYSMTRQLNAIENEKPIQRLSMVEMSVKQIATDLLSMEKISVEMSEKLTKGIDDLNTQAAVSRAQMKWIVSLGIATLAMINAWPVIREMLKALVS